MPDSEKPFSGALAASASLASALSLGARELVSFVGGGGKTSAIRLLAEELSDCGPVLVTTTTGMLLAELATVGSVNVSDKRRALTEGVRTVLDREGVAAAALRPGGQGKVVGLPPAWVDALWGEVGASYLLVEADGSRGLPLKAFGSREPQVPAATTTIVHMAGLDAIGSPLTEAHVHRADMVASRQRVPLGSPVTVDVFAACLLRHVQVLRRKRPGIRIVTFLNKAEAPETEGLAQEVAERLQAGSAGAALQDEIVVGSLRDNRFRRLARRPRVSAIVLAAGLSSRMGGQKVLLPLGDCSLVERVVDAALGSKAAETIVVVGHQAESVRAALKNRAVAVVVNPDPDRGMSSSLQVGVRAVRPGCAAAVFLLADQPFVTASTLDRLIDRFAETGKWVVRPAVRGRPANPVVMSAELFPEILAQRGDIGGRGIAQRHPEQVCAVPFDDAGLDLDIDTGDDYETALRMETEAASRARENR